MLLMGSWVWRGDRVALALVLYLSGVVLTYFSSCLFFSSGYLVFFCPPFDASFCLLAHALCFTFCSAFTTSYD